MSVSRLMTKEELADMLRTSQQTISNQMSQGREGDTVPPAIQLGKNYRWCQDTVFQWLKDKEHERKVLLANPSEAATPKSKVQINRI